MINIYTPNIQKYTSSAIKAINDGWISNLGEYTELAREELKNVIKSKYVVLTNNGTASTHCLFMSLKYKYPNVKKIYVPNNVYVAVWNCVLMEYDISNIEVLKVDLDTYNFDLNELYRLEKDSCLVIVHNTGNIIDTEYIHSKRPDLVLLEDNCEGLFGKLNNEYTGNCKYVLASSCSFYGNKIITSGEGGAFFTNDEDLYYFINKTINQGITAKRYVHGLLGYNYRMTNIEAAFIYDQLLDINNILENKERVFERYNNLLKPLIESKLVSKYKVNDNCKSANWMYIIRVPNKSYNDMYIYFRENNVDTRPFFYPIYTHEHLKDLKTNDNNSELLSKECIMLPSSPSLKLEEQEYIVKVLNKYLVNVN